MNTPIEVIAGATLRWFSEPQATIDDAEALHQPEMLDFDPGAVFLRPDTGDYVLALIQPQMDGRQRTIAEDIRLITGYVMVPYCDGLVDIWKRVDEQL